MSTRRQQQQATATVAAAEHHSGVGGGIGPAGAHVNTKDTSADPSETKQPNKQDVLLQYLPEWSPLAQVRNALLTDGYAVLPSVLNEDECQQAIDSIWDFIEDTSSGTVRRLDSSSWYPKDFNNSAPAEDPWPHVGYKSFSDMFQSNGAGWVLGSVREALAERVFEPLYQTKQLHSSKEGFTFHRPTDNAPREWVEQVQMNGRHMVCGERQLKSVGEHYDQTHSSIGLQTIQSLVALEDQSEGVDGCFLCWPRSYGKIHQALTKDIYRGKFAWVPLIDDEIMRLEDEFDLKPKRIFLKRGDVIVWRSDLVHAAVPPLGVTPRFRAVAYTSMQPACLTPESILLEKMNAYKQRRTGDHRPHEESWHLHRQTNPFHRTAFRTSPPLVSRRLAELYGLIPYVESQEDFKEEQRSAMIRGVRFLPESLPTQPSTKLCTARLEYIAPNTSCSGFMAGQDKYMGGMPSPCGQYIYGVPGTARRVMRINTETNEMDFIGPEFHGKFKWLRGVEIPPEIMGAEAYPRGCCLALPSNANTILMVDPETNAIMTFGEDVVSVSGESGWYYHGGAIGLGMVYAIPANADRVLKIDPRTKECWLIGPSFLGKQKWFGGIIGSDGCIYGIPHNETGVLKIDPKTDECSVLYQMDGSALPAGKWKYHGGLAAGDKIYGYPNNASDVIVVDVKKAFVYTVGDDSILQSGRHRIPQDGRYKYLGGALSLDKKALYLFPCDAERVLKIHTETDDLELVGPLLLDGENKYQNGFVARDGCIYAIPQRAIGILRIDPNDNDHVDVMACGEDMLACKDKFEGGVISADGSAIYCIPLRARHCVKVVIDGQGCRELMPVIALRA